MDLVLYSNDCPRCSVLKTKLENSKLDFKISNDMQKLIDMGFSTVPVLEANGVFMEFSEAFKFINEQG